MTRLSWDSIAVTRRAEQLTGEARLCTLYLWSRGEQPADARFTHQPTGASIALASEVDWDQFPSYAALEHLLHAW